MNRMSYRGGQGGMTIPGGPLGEARYALATGQADKAERIARKRLERQPTDSASRLVLAQALLQQRQVAEAITEARRVTREQPTTADAYLILSAALLQQGGGSPFSRVPAEAETAARKAVQLQPKLARARVQLAEVLVANNDLAGARIAADEAVKLEPRGPSGYFIRALVLMRDKDYDGAIQACDSAIRYDKDHQLSQIEFIKANALLEAKRYDEALTSLSAAERQNPVIGATGYGLRGRIYFKQRKFGQSYNEFKSSALLSGRKRIAPLTALVSMLFSPFGENAQYALLIAVLVIVFLALFGLSLIPVAGSWIVAVLIVAIIGFLAYVGLRQAQGSVLPADASARPITILGMVAAGLVGVVLVAIIERVIAGFTVKNPGFYDLTPTNLGIALCVGVIAAALAGYGIPLLLTRAGGRSRAITAG